MVITPLVRERCFARVLFAIGLVVLAPTAVAQASDAMITGGLTSQPIGHYEFCRANPSECSIRQRDRGPAVIDAALWSRIAAVNAEVNKAVQPISDADLYGKDEVWTYPEGFGDCEDYVLEKRRQLNAEGISLSNLLITVVRKPDGEGHAVLTVRSDGGDFVLDNLSDEVRPWDATGYRYLKRQSSEHTGRWVAIREGSATLVGSVK